MLHSFNLIFLSSRKMVSEVYTCTTGIFAKISFYTTIPQLDFYYIPTIWIQGSSPVQSEIFVNDTILCITLAQPDLHYIRTTWFQGNTLAQPEIFIFILKWHISCYTLTPPTFIKKTFKNMISLVFSFLLCVHVLLHIHISCLYLCLNQVVAWKFVC